MANRINDDHVFYRNPTKYYPPAVKGDGVYIYDNEGKTYIDGSGGAVVAAIGHGVQEVREAMIRQLGQIDFTHGTQFTSKAAASLAGNLVRIAPASLERVYFLSGGSEAVETAVKMARQYQVDRGMPLKYKIISRWTSYHGNTLGALALGGHTGRRRYYQPLIQHTPHIVPAYCYRCPFGLDPEQCCLECADDLEKNDPLRRARFRVGLHHGTRRRRDGGRACAQGRLHAENPRDMQPLRYPPDRRRGHDRYRQGPVGISPSITGTPFPI